MALARGAWAEARALFAEALAREETPEAYEGAGLAARYEPDAEAAIEAHERGYRLARSLGDAATAAGLAIQLGHDAYAFRGPAEASGWVERAALLVEGEPPSVAAAWVSLLRAQFALADHDPDPAQTGSAHALALAREVGAVDVEMLALSVNGLALVSAGEIEAGMRRLDAAAAAAVGGEMTDADSIETVCCHMIDACKLVRDLERANEWCLRVRDIATRFADRQMFSICRTAYADVLLWHGDWERAYQELTAAVDELGALRPGRDIDPLARLAELRRRQGRTSEAEELLPRVESHRFHALLTGLLALDRGDAETAMDAAARFLRRVGEADRFERVAGLDYWVFGGPWTYGESHQDRPGATGVDREVIDELMEAGAAVVGRRMYDVTDGWGGKSPFGVPCIVVTHRVGDQPSPASGFEFVDGIEAAVGRARQIAGDRQVGIGGGASIAQQALQAELVDELQIHIAPVILGAGRPLFGELGTRLQLERTRVLDSPFATHIKFRVLK